MVKQLRDYQTITLHKMDQHLHKKGGRSGIVHLFTGGGKSAITTHFTNEYAHPSTGKRTIVVGGVNQVLTWQMYDNFVGDFPGLRGVVPWQGKMVKAIGIVMNNQNDIDARIIIGSMQTLAPKEELSAAKRPREIQPIERSDILVSKNGTVHLAPKSERRYLVSERMDAILAAGGLFDYWHHDEAHHSLSDSSVIIINRLQEIHKLLDKEPMKVIGNTATPARTDKRGLHTLYETLFVSYDYQYGQRHNYLVPFAQPLRILVDTVETDRDGNKSGVFEEKTTVRYINNWAEVIAQGWLEKAEGRPTFSYVSQHNGANHVDDSIHLTRTMQGMGIRAAHTDGFNCIGPDGEEWGKKRQRDLLKMMQRGELDVINNYGVLIEGVDVTRVSCILNARRISDDNPVLLTQMLGRGLRPDPASGKKDLLVIDATGMAYALNGIAELSGYKVDPSQRSFIEDFDIDAIFEAFVRIYEMNSDKVQAWQLSQSRYAISTIQEAFNLAFKLDKDNVSNTHLRCLQDCIDWCQDEDRLMDGIDPRDLRTNNNIHGVNQSYSLIEITRKSKAAWYVNESSALMSLSVASGASFVLHPPNHTRARLCREALTMLKEPDNELTTGKTPAQLEMMQQFLNKSLELFENFTLWQVDTQKVWETQIPANLLQEKRYWIQADEGLDYLEDYAFSYARENVEGYSANFAEKKKRGWAKEQPTEKQIQMYEKLTGSQGLPADWTRGELSDRINHFAAVKPVEEVVTMFETRIDKLKEIL